MGPLGIRLNNPCNLRPNQTTAKNPFFGQVTKNAPKNYLAFQDYLGNPGYFWGLRAAAQCIIQKQFSGFETLIQLGDGIEKDGKKLGGWCPADDNPGSKPGDYGRDISSILLGMLEVSIKADQKIQFNDFLPHILPALVIQENGKGGGAFSDFPFWYPMSEYLNAINSARIAKGITKYIE